MKNNIRLEKKDCLESLKTIEREETTTQQEITDKIKSIIEYDIVINETRIVEYLFETDYFSCDNINNYIDEEGYEKYIAQWYRVTDQLYNDLDSLGAAVITDRYGNYFWGRVSGCALEEDYALVEIALKLLKK